MSERSDLVETAKCAERSERYDDMAATMKNVVEKDPKLTPEERNLLSVAYKNVVGARRSAWRVISSIEAKLDGSSDKLEAQCTKKYKEKIVKELTDLCNEVVVG